MKNNLLCIVGPTGVGKTKLAEEVKKELDSRLRGNDNAFAELLSIDSRQVYVGMDIGTGKDAHIFGTDLVKPDKLFNVADFCRLIKPQIELLWMQNKLPILVGGTGLYFKALLDGFDSLNIPPNEKLRKELTNLSVEELQQKLLSMYPYIHNNPAGSGEEIKMNNSDWNNSRRLIRKIEISEYYSRVGEGLSTLLRGERVADPPLRINKILIIGLTAPLLQIKKNIGERVQKRLDKGLLEEIKGLIKLYGWNEVMQSTIGYQEWEDHFAGKITKEKTIEKWINNEFNYAKRQLTWFRKDRRVNWIDNDHLEKTIKLMVNHQFIK